MQQMTIKYGLPNKLPDSPSTPAQIVLLQITITKHDFIIFTRFTKLGIQARRYIEKGKSWNTDLTGWLRIGSSVKAL